MPSFSGPLACFAIFSVLVFLFVNNDLAGKLSPQGCRMSYMSPSYVLRDSFNASWSRLSGRYSLWLYREVGWDLQVPNGRPVLFIPGNAGSSHQVRSIASSAARQFYSSPGQASTDYVSRGISVLDFYAVEFNEDLSAFHGTTLHSQIEYTSKAVDYILSHYPPNTPLMILGHSMGGIVGTSLLPSERISAIITMSTPHNLPPARFDSRIDDIYANTGYSLEHDTTPILSLCGGATDMMIPSESCVLPSSAKKVYRRTIFTSALEGAWTGVGHREMVWCHQVRWRVARALLEMTSQKSLERRQEILDTWLRDGHELPPGISAEASSSSTFELSDRASYEIIPQGLQLIRRPVGSPIFLLPFPPASNGRSVTRLSILVGKGAILPVSPQVRHGLEVSVFTCTQGREDSKHPYCTPLRPETLKLIPRPVPGQPFPSPRLASDSNSGGVDESDGVVLYEAEVAPHPDQWVGIGVGNGNGQGWIAAGFNHKEAITSVISTPSLLFQKSTVSIEAEGSLRLDVSFPRLLSNALVVYRITPHFKDIGSCVDSPLAPLLIHTSHTVETHYYPLVPVNDQLILLHTHLPAPYHDLLIEERRGVHLVIYSSGISSCIDNLKELEISIDWFATLGRWASRFVTTVVGWAAGISSIFVFLGLGIYDRGAPMPSISQTIRHYGKFLWRFMVPLSFAASFLPWPTGLYLGLGGSGSFAPLAPLMLIIASGLVITLWWVLRVFLWALWPVGKLFATRKHDGSAVGRSTAISMCIIFMMIFLFVPWQVAYLGCWIYQLITCAAAGPEVASRETIEYHPLVDRSNDDTADGVARPQLNERTRDRASIQRDNYHLNCHILLFMTWLLPLAAPVLAVWVRTLITAGLTTPFDGDHFFLSVAPFLVLVDFSSWSAAPILVRQRFEDRISARWALVTVAVTSFLAGGTRPHRVFDAGKVSLALLVAIRIGRRYWGGASWSATEPRRRAS